MLRENMIALQQGVVGSAKLSAEAMKCTCDISNMSVTTSIGANVTPYKVWYGVAAPLGYLQPFGTMEHMRMPTHEHKLAPRGEHIARHSALPPEWPRQGPQ